MLDDRIHVEETHEAILDGAAASVRKLASAVIASGPQAEWPVPDCMTQVDVGVEQWDHGCFA